MCNMIRFFMQHPTAVLRHFGSFFGVFLWDKKGGGLRLMARTPSVKVLEAGLEPAQPQWPKDFKSFVSTIPPFERP